MSAFVNLAASVGDSDQMHLISGNNGSVGRWNLGIYDHDLTSGIEARLFWFQDGGLNVVVAEDFDFNSNLDQWVHVGITRDSDGATTLYVNGVGTSVGNSTAPLISTEIGIGERPNASRFQFHGRIDDLRFYSRALTTWEMEAFVLPDSDGDGIPDQWETGTGIFVSETDTGTDPFLWDTDGDGLSDGDEIFRYHTDPNMTDTDGDGFDDAFEVSTGFDPVNASSTPDALSTIRTAVEFRFNAANDVSYRIEVSEDLQSWSTIENTIIGTGQSVTRFYSTENQGRRYFRVRRN